MLIFEKKNALEDCLSFIRQQNKQIGFVPTMGALHKGHISLIESSKENNDTTVASIFVNPIQFNDKEDLEKYPKTLENDLKLLRNIDCDIVFIPDIKEVYTDNEPLKSFAFDGIENQMEGEFRKGHFDGVATIVQAFFKIIIPDRAYFGEKDFQQLQIVRKLVQKNKIPVQIIGCPIFREDDGLAMSSRNIHLNKNHRETATFIYKTLKKVQKKIDVENPKEITEWVDKQFKKQPLLELEYFNIADEETLKTAKIIDPAKKYRAFIAVFSDKIRLIDNIFLIV